MPLYISPLDDTYIRFDAVAELLASRDSNTTQDSILEMLVHAMWRGDFDPPDWDDTTVSNRNDPKYWLCVPIEAPSFSLTKSQLKLSSKPVDYYEAGRSTVISVMHCKDMLPGNQKGWCDMLDGGDGKSYLHDRANALSALSRLPLNAYTEAGKTYFLDIYIPRRMLQKWVDRQSSKFAKLFNYEKSAEQTKPTVRVTDLKAQPSKTKRGRPVLAAWEPIEAWALRENAQHPKMPRKQLAGLLYELAIKHFDVSEVPNETTILRKLSSILDNPKPPFHGNA